MALNAYTLNVNYEAQLDAFKDFLKHFKSFESASESAATEAIEDLRIDEDGTSDEYDFMDDVAQEGSAQRAGRRRREPKLKYMQVLQEVADRERTNILIELDDLATVSASLLRLISRPRLTCYSMRKAFRMTWTCGLLNPCRRTPTIISIFSLVRLMT